MADASKVIDDLVSEAVARVRVEVGAEAERQVADLLRSRGWAVSPPLEDRDAEARRQARPVLLRQVRLFGISADGRNLYEVVG